MYRNNVLMLNLTAFSLLCLVILVGGFLYSGSILPSTGQGNGGESLTIWIVWSILVALPLITAVLWILRLQHKR